MSCWKISKNEIEKNFYKRVDNRLSLWYDIKVATAAENKPENTSGEVDLWKLNKVRQTKCVGRLDSIQDNKHF